MKKLSLLCVLALFVMLSSGCSEAYAKKPTPVDTDTGEDSDTLGEIQSALINGSLIVPNDGASGRVLYLWDYYKAKTSTQRAELQTFCRTFGVNIVLVEMSMFIGNHPSEGERWTTDHVGYLQELNAALHAVGVTVYGLDGYACWPIHQDTVMMDVGARMVAFNNMSTDMQEIDGLALDIEWWYCSEEDDADIMVPQMLNLMQDLRNLTGKPVGIYEEAWTLEWGESVAYRGVTKTEGQHVVDNMDMVFVEMYDDDYSDQLNKIDNWVAYANSSSNRPRIYGISLVNDNSDDDDTYWQETNSAMESSHSAIKVEMIDNMDYKGTTFRGNGVHHYGDYCKWLENQSLFDCSFY